MEACIQHSCWFKPCLLLPLHPPSPSLHLYASAQLVQEKVQTWFMAQCNPLGPAQGMCAGPAQSQDCTLLFTPINRCIAYTYCNKMFHSVFSKIFRAKCLCTLTCKWVLPVVSNIPPKQDGKPIPKHVYSEVHLTVKRNYSKVNIDNFAAREIQRSQEIIGFLPRWACTWMVTSLEWYQQPQPAPRSIINTSSLNLQYWSIMRRAQQSVHCQWMAHKTLPLSQKNDQVALGIIPEAFALLFYCLKEEEKSWMKSRANWRTTTGCPYKVIALTKCVKKASYTIKHPTSSFQAGNYIVTGKASIW